MLVASLLLALLVPNAAGQPFRLQHLMPLSLERAGRELKIYPDRWGFQAYAASGDRFVVRTRTRLQVIDTRALTVAAAYPFRPRAICTVGLDGDTVVVLYGCRSASSTAFRLWRIGPTGRRSLSVRGLGRLRYPTSAAVGDGTCFLARGNGDVEAIDLRTGAVAHHRRPRALAKAGLAYTEASWLGRHRLGLNGTVVDVRTWRRRTLAAGARELRAAEGWTFAFGTNGITVYDGALRLYRRIARGRVIDDAAIHGGIVYAQIGLAWDLYDVRTGRHLATVLPDTPWLVQLL